MTGWKDDGEYWTKKGRIHHNGGGKYIVSVKKSTKYVLKSIPKHHDKLNHRGAT